MTGTTVTRDGKPLAIGTAAAYDKLAAAFLAATGKTLRVTSGLRTKAEQEALFYQRYKVQLRGTGVYNDVKWYKLKRYVRVSGAGTVAVPGTSRHEPGNAVDVGDSGSFPGVETAGNTRSDWMRANAAKYRFRANGYGFGEPWHIEFIGDPWKAPAPSTAPLPGSKGDVYFSKIERCFAKPGGNTEPLFDIKAVQQRLEDAVHVSLTVGGKASGLVDEPTRAAYLQYEKNLVKIGFLPVANSKPTLEAVQRLCYPDYNVIS